jgi:hypothetical protein
MQAIELETTIGQEGALHLPDLPEQYSRSFGTKARVIVLLGEATDTHLASKGQADKLMEFAGKLDWPIADPVVFQRECRDEWNREWE